MRRVIHPDVRTTDEQQSGISGFQAPPTISSRPVRSIDRADDRAGCPIGFQPQVESDQRPLPPAGGKVWPPG
jgi:hypothetical protein